MWPFSKFCILMINFVHFQLFLGHHLHAIRINFMADVSLETCNSVISLLLLIL